jgi:hypothetical protein
MTKKIGFSVILFFLVLLSFCSRLSYDIVPHKTALYHSLGIKVNVRNTENSRRDNFKILLKYDDTRDKMLFLSPLNQVYGLLLLEKEKALLIDTKKKKYWQGTFNTLIQEIWGLDFDYREFKQLIVSGILPEEKINQQGIDISFAEGTPTENPEKLNIQKGTLSIKIKISSRKTGKGLISFSKSVKGMKQTGIRELLDSEEGG